MTRKMYRFGAATVWLALAFAAALPAQGQSTLVILDRDSTFDTDGTFDNGIYRKFYYDPAATVPNDLAAALDEARDQGIENIIVVGREDGGVYPDRFRFQEDDVFTIQGFPGESPSSTVIRADETGPAVDAAEPGVDVTLGNMTLLSVEVGDTLRANASTAVIPAATAYTEGVAPTQTITDTDPISELSLRFSLSAINPAALSMTLTHTPPLPGTPLTVTILAANDIQAVTTVTDIEIDEESDQFLPDLNGSYDPGRYRPPNDSLSAFNGRTVEGDWTLTVAGATLTDWTLINASVTDILLTPDPLSVASLNVGIVTAELYLTHPEVSDLELFLISPDGTTVRLASAPFVSGPDFGTADEPTLFADAGLPLESGVAPYEGAFRPLGALIGFEGETHLRNEDWTLRIFNGGVEEGTHNESALEITEVTRGPNAVLVANGATLSLEICDIFLADDGVRVEADSTLTMDRCYLRSTTDNAVLVTGADAVATSICNSLFVFNDGAAVRAEDGAEVTLVSYCTLMRNGIGVITSGAPAATLNIESSLVYLNDGFGLEQDTGTITTEGNYVLRNSGDTSDQGHFVAPNYSGLTPDATSTGLFLVDETTADPSFDNDPLVSTGVSETGVPGFILVLDSPLVDREPTPACGELDFLGLPRGVRGSLSPSSDVGAFEFVDEELFQFAWYECRVKDVEVPREQYIGKADVGDVAIDVRTFSVPRSVFILPQGEILIPGDDTNRIFFDYVRRSGQVSTWENITDITTLMADDDGDPGLSIGDFIADGHGSVFLSFADSLADETFDNITGYDGDSGSPSDGGLILDQALIGRHVIIDTIPPRPTAVVPPLLRAKDFVLNWNDGVTPGGIIGAPTHPYPAAPSSFPTVGVWEPGVDPAPQDNGGIGLPSGGTGGTGGTILFNHASVSNFAAVGTPADPANFLGYDYAFGVTDDVVRDPDDPSIVLTAEDHFLGVLKERQPGGFFDDAGAVSVGEWQYLLGRNLSQAPEAEWGNLLLRLVPGSDSLAPDTVVSLTGNATNLAGYTGWDVSTDSGLPVTLFDTYTANVSFYNGGTPTIPFLEVLNDGHLHLGIQFVGSDAAGNTTPFVDDPDTPGDDAKVLDPIHMWWITETAPRLSPERGGTRTKIEETSFTLGIDRGFSPTIVGQPRPAYTYRMWRAQTPGDSDAARTGVFENFGAGWRTWTQQNQIPPTYFRELATNIAGYWVVLAAAVIDEAGNVSPMDPNLGYDALLDTVNSGALTRGVGWQKFFIDGGITPETEADAFFWFDLFDDFNPALYEPNRRNAIGLSETAVAEGAGVVPSPPVAYELEYLRLNARFDFTIAPRGPVPPNGAGQLVRTGVFFELIREGDESNIVSDLVIFQPVGQGRTQGSVVAPVQTTGWFDGNRRLEDIFGPFGRKAQGQRQPIRYVLRAYGWVDLDNDSVADPGELDPTPANIPFTVVPESNIGNYIDPKDSPDDQPIKVNEAR